MIYFAWFPGPESYTGEDMAEIHIHGSIANEQIDQLSKIDDCRLAEPGEFTKLAFQMENKSLKAESISDLISLKLKFKENKLLK